MACERCWDDAFKASKMLGGSQADHYRRLLNERDGVESEMVKCGAYNFHRGRVDSARSSERTQ